MVNKKLLGNILLEEQIEPAKGGIRNLQGLAGIIADFERALDEAIVIPSYPMKLVPGTLNMIVAPTGIGKTTILQHTALHAINMRQNADVIYITLEQEVADIARGLTNLSAELGIQQAFTNLYVERVNAGNIPSIRKQFEHILSQEFDYIVIDYIKPAIIEGEGSGYEKMGKIMSVLQDVLHEYANESIILVAVQGNSSSEGKGMNEIAMSPSRFITEGSRTLETMSSGVFITRQPSGQRQLVVIKSRYENDLLTKQYDLNFSPHNLITLSPLSDVAVGVDAVKNVRKPLNI